MEKRKGTALLSPYLLCLTIHQELPLNQLQVY